MNVPTSGDCHGQSHSADVSPHFSHILRATIVSIAQAREYVAPFVSKQTIGNPLFAVGPQAFVPLARISLTP